MSDTIDRRSLITGWMSKAPALGVAVGETAVDVVEADSALVR